jgi:hypothetical protein
MERDTPRGASPISGIGGRDPRGKLRASGIARRRAEEEGADTLFVGE